MLKAPGAMQAHCRRLATGHLPAAAQGVALDANPVVESGNKEMSKGPAQARSGAAGRPGEDHPSAAASPSRPHAGPPNWLVLYPEEWILHMLNKHIMQLFFSVWCPCNLHNWMRALWSQLHALLFHPVPTWQEQVYCPSSHCYGDLIGNTERSSQSV